MAVWELLQGSKTASPGPMLHRGGHTATTVGNRIFVVAGRKGSRFWRDLLCYCTRQQAWQVLQATIPLPARANHHAVLVGGRHLWVMGGADEDTVFGDVWVLDIETLVWTQPELRGATQLLARCSAGADLHPALPHIVLLFGGYGMTVSGSTHTNHYNDIISLDTLTGQVTSMNPAGPVPSPRCFHSFTTVEDRCWVVGGRIIEQGPLQGPDMVAIYDPLANAWLPCHMLTPDAALGGGAGALDGPRSSHKSVAVDGQLLVTGGNLGQPGAPLAVWLRMEAGRSATAKAGRVMLRWSDKALPHAAPGSQEPDARAAHGANLVGSCVYLTLGYTGDKSKAYLPDVLALRLDVSQLAGRGPAPAHPAAAHTHTVARAVGVWDAATGQQRVQATVTQVQCTGAAAVGQGEALDHALRASGATTAAAGSAVKPSAGTRLGGRASPAPATADGGLQRLRRNDAGAGDEAGHDQARTPTTAGAGKRHGTRPSDAAPAAKRPSTDVVVDLTGGEGEGEEAAGGGERPAGDGSGWQRKKARASGPGSPGRGGYATLPVHPSGRAGTTPGTTPLVTPTSRGQPQAEQGLAVGSGTGGEGRQTGPRHLEVTPQGPGQQHGGGPGGSGSGMPPGGAPLQRLRTAPRHTTAAGQAPPVQDQAPASPAAAAQGLCPVLGCPYHSASSPSRHMAYVDQAQVHLLQQQLADMQLQLSKGLQSELMAQGRAEMDRQAMETLRSSLADARASLAHKSSELASTDAALREARKQANSVVLQHQSLVTEKNQWLLERQRMQQEEAALHARCRDLESRVQALEVSLDGCQADSLRSTTHFEQRLAAKDATAAEQAGRINMLVTSLEALRADNTRHVEAQKRLEHELTESRERLTEAQHHAALQSEAAAQREAELRRALDLRLEELRVVQQESASRATELATSKAREVQLTSDLDATRHAADAATATCGQLRAQIATLQASMRQAGSKLAGEVQRRQEEMRHAMDEMQRSMETFLAADCMQQGLEQGSAGPG